VKRPAIASFANLWYSTQSQTRKTNRITKPDAETRPQIDTPPKADYDPEQVASKEYFDQWFQKLTRRIEGESRNLDTIAKAIQDEDEKSSAFKKRLK